ncbi:hypothetical protein GW17_00026040 [Ensete ventricosum]|nr:hypothetical protein GW17_00026040 [Ensete ventricosum]
MYRYLVGPIRTTPIGWYMYRYLVGPIRTTPIGWYRAKWQILVLLSWFVEHMLFMGSSEFPDENEYDHYLSKHGGSTNAFTETEYTCYYFEVNREYLKGALKR